MKRQSKISERRKFLMGIAAISAYTVTSSVLHDQALAKILTTPAQTEGPFYPIHKAIDQDADLTRVGNNSKRAAGDLLVVQGKVLTPNDSPVANALVEIWQTNAWGRYHDHRDRSDAPLDPNFQGYGHYTSENDGTYQFLTIKPAAYGQGYWRRTPHIHFRISGRHFDRFTTQMYFAGEPENANDGLLNRISDPAMRKSLIVDLEEKKGIKNLPQRDMKAHLASFNIVLGQNL